MLIADQVYMEGGDNLTITSVTDGQHMRASIHYVGGAFDASLPTGPPSAVALKLRQRLGPDYDVVVEVDHIHIEWQPKMSY